MPTHFPLKVILHRWHFFCFNPCFRTGGVGIYCEFFDCGLQSLFCFNFLCFSKRERDIEAMWLRNPLFLLQLADGYCSEREREDMIETGTEKVLHSQMKANEEWQLLYRPATQTQIGWERLEQHPFSLSSITQQPSLQVLDHRPIGIESNYLFYSQLFICTLKSKGFLLVPWRKFNIHATFPFHERVFIVEIDSLDF